MGIDRVDAAMLLLFGARRRLVQAAMRSKQRAQLPLRDRLREAKVLRRARAIGAQHGLPPAASTGLLQVLIADAWHLQRLDTDAWPSLVEEAICMNDTTTSLHPANQSLLRLLPPPRRLAPLLRLVPPALQARALEAALARVLARPLQQGALEFLRGHTLGVQVSDLGLQWAICLEGDRLQVCGAGTAASATVCATATDLLLLATRQQDADTLFFQRRLRMTGDTELGLTVRNLLDQLPWEQVPLGIRIALDRAARLAQRSRDAWQRAQAPASVASEAIATPPAQ